MSFAERSFDHDGQPAEAPPAIRVAVAVVDEDQSVRNRLAMQLGEGTATFTTVDELSTRLTGAVPVVTILGPSCAHAEELSRVERLVTQHNEVGAILVAGELSTALLQQALRVGVRDVLTVPVDTGQLGQAVQKVAVALEVARTTPGSTSDPTVDTGGELGRVVTVFSTKGGSGKSVIATNLAVVLARRSDRPVCLVDADLQFGDVAVLLKLAPQHTIVDAVGSIDRLDVGLMQSLLVTHEPSSLQVLPAPLEPAFADQIGGREMVAVIDVLRRFCSFVVVDTPAYFNDVVLGVVEASDEVLLVAGLDIPNIKNLKIGLQTLRLLNTPMEKLHLVLNRANSKVKLDASEVERTLQIKAEALIPSDVVVPTAVNKGVPVVIEAPKSPVARSFDAVADLLLPAAQAAGRRKRK